MYYTKSEIETFTKYDTIVKVSEKRLLISGFHRFVTEYRKYNYGYLFNRKTPYFDDDDNVGIILPVSFGSNIDRIPHNYYINYFRSEYCKFYNMEPQDFHNIPLSERINSFYEIKHYICQPFDV